MVTAKIMQSKRSNSSRFASKSSTTYRMLNLSNTLSVKSILIAMQYAGKYAEVVFAETPSNRFRIRRLKLYISRLESLSSLLHSNEPVDTEDLHRELKLASIAYVNLFYGASESDRDAYLSCCMSENLTGNIAPEKNVITLPSIMAENGIPIGKASLSLLCSVHKKPFVALRSAIKAAISMEMFKNSFGMDTSKEDIIKRLDGKVNDIDSAISNINYLIKDTKTIEKKKLEIINDMYEIEGITGFQVTSIIESSVMPYEYSKHTIIRK